MKKGKENDRKEKKNHICEGHCWSLTHRERGKKYSCIGQRLERNMEEKRIFLVGW